MGVSSKTGTITVAYSLKELSNDVCLSILAHHALGTGDFSAHLNHKVIGERIVGRCKGSPLAAKVLGGVLRNKIERDEWEDVWKSKICDLLEVGSEIAPTLMLSYHHLPSNLKRCFVHCSVLLKDYEFEEKQLVLLWMADGLLQPQDSRKQMEDLGSEYFRNLMSRSFFQQSFKDESRFLMHDLINDLANGLQEIFVLKWRIELGLIMEGNLLKRLDIHLTLVVNMMAFKSLSFSMISHVHKPSCLLCFEIQAIVT
jgi:hypothetical protein